MKPSPLALADLPARDGEAVTGVVETPKCSPNKYGFDHGAGAFRLDAVLPEGTVFPFDFGFIPSTRGEDGDPLDVLAFLDAPTPVGCVVAARQCEGEGWISNDRLLAVASQSHTSAHVGTPDDLRPPPLDETEAFFIRDVGPQAREISIEGRHGPEHARALPTDGMARAEERE